jgi:phosphatidate cytidylyltransferase
VKKRVLSAAAGLVILFTVFFLFDTFLLNIAVSIIAVMTLGEALIAAGIRKGSSLHIAGIIYGAVLPLMGRGAFLRYYSIITFLFILTLVCFILKWHEQIGVEQVAMVFFFALVIGLPLNCFVLARDEFGSVAGLYMALVIFVAAWMNDTGAYFFGIKYGRNKLAANISPKKTVEGAIGGASVALASQIIAIYVFIFVMGYFGTSVRINGLIIVLISPALSVLGILGDLFASQTKRQFGIKDFGNIMPGHGGALDRFDSVLLIIPLVFWIFSNFTVVNVIG